MKRIKKTDFLRGGLALGAFICMAALSAQQLPYNNDYAFGLDVSFVKAREDAGRVYLDVNGEEKPCLAIFSDHGYNWGRIMICNEPDRLPQDLDYVIEAAHDPNASGFKFLLDYMFSNGWANPMTQPTPSEWTGLSHEARITAVYRYVKETLTAMKKAGVLPDMVQVGNEIGNGFLWPAGRIRYDEPDLSRWDQFTDYLSAAIRAIHEVAGEDNKIEVMLHVDHGGDIPMTRTFCGKMTEYGIEYDVLGISFYPWSHGTLLDLRDNMRFVAENYQKEIIAVETGYHWTPSRYFDTRPGPFPETPEGQRNWLEEVNRIVLDTPGGLGKGIFWWEPMQRRRGYFDEDGKALPIIHAFEKFTRPEERTDGQTRIQ